MLFVSLGFFMLQITFRIKVKFLTLASIQYSVMSDSLRSHWLQHARLPCPSPTPRAYSNSCPSSRWCHPTTSSSVVPFSSCPQSFPASGSFQMSQLFTSGGQSIGVSVYQAPLSMGFPRQEYRGGLPFPSLRDLPNPRLEHMYLWHLLHCRQIIFTTEPLLSLARLTFFCTYARMLYYWASEGMRTVKFLYKM